MNRISATFAALRADGRTALIPYIMTGFPQPDSTVGLMHALAEAGADVIELGIPFSDPMADGPVIQAAGEAAIAHGVGLVQVLQAVRTFRQRNTHTPVVLMGYANSVEAYCLHHAPDLAAGQAPVADTTLFAQAAADTGVDGVLVVDYPPEACATLAAALRARGLDMIFLLAPTSTPQRMAQIAQWASGYVYYVSVKGVTGSGALDVEAIASALPRIREHVSAPVGVGFGIRDADSACAIARHADAVVIGSKIIELITHQQGEAAEQAAADFIRHIRSALDAQPAAAASPASPSSAPPA